MSRPITEVRAGKIKGRDDGEVASYLGVPFARAERFRPAMAHPAWKGVREAVHPGPIAPQATSGLGSNLPGDPTEQSEDCLVANIFTPLWRPESLPVLVFFHGGAFVSGTGASVMYDGTSLARRGTVVVTFNYRLGAVGYLAHRCLVDASTGSIGNWGLSDQLAALGWVRDNIAAFGGDPSKVTAFGESAGAMSIADLFGVPSAAGLFDRAILESGTFAVQDVRSAESAAVALCHELGIAVPSRKALLDVPAGELVEAQAAVNGSIMGPTAMRFRPVVDGALLPCHPAASVAAGAGAGIEVLAGTNRDEFSLFTFSLPELAEAGSEQLIPLLQSYLDSHGPGAAGLAAPLVEAYRRRSSESEPSSREIFEAIGNDLVFRVPLDRFLLAQSRAEPAIYSYLFDWESPIAGGRLGACHALELPFVFGTLDNPLIGAFVGAGDEALELSQTMQEAWVAFASRGNPSSETLGSWPRYEEMQRLTMRLGRNPGAFGGINRPARELFDRLLPDYASGDGARVGDNSLDLVGDVAQRQRQSA